MAHYLDYQFTDTPEFISTFDEAPLWSAAFGLLLLKHLALKRGITVLDVGSGAGFPLMELAARLGPSCRLFGLDPWTNANDRARQKIKNYGLTNVEIIEGSAAEIPLADTSVDLVVSNLGINNFDQPEKMFSECCRVLKPGGKLALTTNLNGHWREFYRVFEQTLQSIGRDDLLEKLKAEESHRGSIASVSAFFTNNGFLVERIFEEPLDMQFLDGSAFLNHYFVKLGWLSSWRNLIPEADQKETFDLLERNLNEYAHKYNGLRLTVPMAYVEGKKS